MDERTKRLVTWEAIVEGAPSDEDALAAAVDALFSGTHYTFSIMEEESGPARHYSVNVQMILDALQGKEANNDMCRRLS
jgi:hypothetical protein